MKQQQKDLKLKLDNIKVKQDNTDKFISEYIGKLNGEDLTDILELYGKLEKEQLRAKLIK